MKKINAIINSFTFLLLAVLMSACNKDGIETIVIEDGQPSVAQMIIGTWNPDRGEIVDEEGNVTEEIDKDDIPWLDFKGDGDEPFGTGESGNGESFDWSVDEGSGPVVGGGSGYDGEGPSIYWGDERWYIFQLTERILIIYRFYGDYILIYYYYRVGDYNEPEPEPMPEPSGNCPYQPQFSDNQRIIRIEETGNAAGYKFENIYLYEYDDLGRISSFSYGASENELYWTWNYQYDAEKVSVALGDGSDWFFEGYFNEDGYVTRTRNVRENEEIAWYDYNNEGYLTGGKTMDGYIDVEYDNNWNPLSIRYPYGQTWQYTYTRDDMNSYSVDLNKVVCLAGFQLDASQTDFDGFFAQFDFLGHRAPYLVATENTYEVASGPSDVYEFSYEMANGRIVQIIRYRGNYIYTYRIYYAN